MMKNRTHTIMASIFTLPFFIVLSVLGRDKLNTPIIISSQIETQAFFEDASDQFADADDPAIWIHPFNDRKSLVVGTLKEGGLAVFDLKGKLIQRIEVMPELEGTPKSRFNNVDIIQLDDWTAVFAVSDRGRDQIRFFEINPWYFLSKTPPLKDVTDTQVPWVFSKSNAELQTQNTAYGLASGFDHKTGSWITWVTQRNRLNIQAVKVIKEERYIRYETLLPSISLPDTFHLNNGKLWSPCLDDDETLPGAEGLFFDVPERQLYIAQELVGIWSYGLDDQTLTLIDKVKNYGIPYTRTWNPEEQEYECEFHYDQSSGEEGQYLEADVEGLTVYRKEGQQDAILMASSQGSSELIAYHLKQVAGSSLKAKRFQIVHMEDRVMKTDGLMAVSNPMTSLYPSGLLVIHDGKNQDVSEEESTNFKWVDMQNLLPYLDIDAN